ncbi:hypothetical protein FRC08_005567 [Ceratobasidium sp. 394]|nr:hypothetical protein FRC08_005567 [Ceratobasidium sp. 394]
MDVNDGLAVDNVEIGELAQLIDAIEPDNPGLVLNDLGAAQANVDARYVPAQGLHQNPPVTIEDWPDSDDDLYHREDGFEDNLAMA